MTNVQLYKLRAFAVLWHSIVLVQLSYAWYFDATKVRKAERGIKLPRTLSSFEFGGSARFLTHWCLTWNSGVFGSLCILFHLVAATTTWYGIYYDFIYVHFPKDPNALPSKPTDPIDSYGGKFKFLTVLDAFVQAIYFTIALINDFIGSNELSPRSMPLVRRLKDYMMAAFAFPLAFNVSITFWGLYAIDRELVFPTVLDAIFPSWLNHVLHTNIAIFIVLEMCTSFRRYPERRNGVAGLTVFMVAYLVWIHIIYYKSGLWVYPILEVLNFPARLAFFAASIVFSLALYRLGEFLNAQIWTKELRQLKGRKSH